MQLLCDTRIENYNSSALWLLKSRYAYKLLLETRV